MNPEDIRFFAVLAIVGVPLLLVWAFGTFVNWLCD